MPEPTTLIAVPAELLAGMADTMRDAATLARDTSGGLRALEGKIDALQRAHDAHIARTEPALQTYADTLRRMAEADADATAEARQARRKAETEEVKRRTELYGVAVKLLVALASLVIAALAGAGGMAALGGSP